MGFFGQHWGKHWAKAPLGGGGGKRKKHIHLKPPFGFRYGFQVNPQTPKTKEPEIISVGLKMTFKHKESTQIKPIFKIQDKLKTHEQSLAMTIRKKQFLEFFGEDVDEQLLEEWILLDSI